MGHRGAGARATPPENTIESFDAALHHGCDGFEFDVRLTGCGCPVICHDPKFAGVTISRANKDQLPGVLRLPDVLRRYARSFLDIELKVRALETAILVALAESPPEKGYVVSSFLPEVLKTMRLRSETIPLGLICDKASQLARWRELPVQYVILHHSLARRELLRDIRDAGKTSFIWTVNDRESMLRFAEWSVDGIISDETELMVRTLRAAA
jgi:glycerophosphoryl diester phosphodiesterase